MIGNLSLSPSPSRTSFDQHLAHSDSGNTVPTSSSQPLKEGDAKESPFPQVAQSTMEFRLRRSGSIPTEEGTSVAPPSLKELTGLDEADIRKMYETNKDAIKKEAIPMALGWAEETFGKTLVRAVRWAVGGSLDKVVDRLLNDTVQNKMFDLLVKHLKAFFEKRNQDSGNINFVDYLYAHTPELAKEGVDIIDERMKESSYKAIYEKFGLSGKALQIASEKEKMKALIMLALKHCNCPPSFLEALGIEEDALKGNA